jgi:putative hydrolase of the HAD superfamily
MIKCLTFDLDDTLWDIRPVIKNLDKKLYQWLVANAPAYTQKHPIEHFIYLKNYVITHFPEIAHSVTQVRIKGLELGLKDAGYSDIEASVLAEQGFVVALKARQEVEYFAHTWAALDDLRDQGYIMGAITNGNADINKVGLEAHFDFQFSADQSGVEKPHPLIYQQMLDHIQLPAQSVIHIGDNPIADVQGAQQLGMSTIWVNVLTQQWKHDFKADEQIDCLSDLPKAVERIVKKRLL